MEYIGVGSITTTTQIILDNNWCTILLVLVIPVIQSTHFFFSDTRALKLLLLLTVSTGPGRLVVELEVEVTLRLTVGRYVLVSSTLVGLATRYYFLSECCCLKFAVLFL
jgi:hypothetical protein